jgi:shikimate kinase
MTTIRRVYVIGFMGSGKSTASKKLAAALGWQFIDLDREIELKAGKSIKEIFSNSGETYFRELEEKTLLNLKSGSDSIISTGGGTPCYGENMDFMIRTGLVVYLRMTPSQLMSRLEGEAASRPLIKDLKKTDLLQYISDKLAEREKYYLRATIKVDGLNLDIKALCDQIRASGNR